MLVSKVIYLLLPIYQEHLFNPKCQKIGTRRWGRLITCKNMINFSIIKIKIAISQNFSKVGFYSFFLWPPTHKTNLFSLKKWMKQDKCDGSYARVACILCFHDCSDLQKSSYYLRGIFYQMDHIWWPHKWLNPFVPGGR